MIDGVVIQYPRQNAYLSVDSFEATVLQPASVLWVNRRPAPELVESGRIIDIALPPDIGEIGGGQFVWDLIADWTEKISWMTENGYGAMLRADWVKSAPELDEMLTELENIIKPYGAYFGGELMEENHSILQSPSSKDIFTYFRYLESQIENDFWKIVKRSRKGEDDPILAAGAEIEEIFAQYWKVIKKNRKQNINKHFSFGCRYDEAVRHMISNPKYSGIGIDTIEKMAYLYTSFRLFVGHSIPKGNQKEVFSIFKKSLDELFVKDKRSPQEILEKYIKGLLTEKHFARVRGKGSDRPDVRVWYDARHNLFLLPKDTYFSDFQKLHPEGPAITQTEWEQQLVKSDLVLYATRTKQKRYGYEIKLRKGSDQKQAVLKIPCDKLSKEFFEDTAIKAAIEQMKADPTKLRS